MNILFVSDYPAWLKVAKGEMPSHHLFGVFEMIDHFRTPSSAVIKQSLGGEKLTLKVVLV